MKIRFLLKMASLDLVILPILYINALLIGEICVEVVIIPFYNANLEVVVMDVKNVYKAMEKL